MRILQLCLRLPWPLNDGGARASFQFTRGLRAKGQELCLLALNTRKHWQDPDTVAQASGARVLATPIDTGIRPLAALRSLLLGHVPYNVERFYSAEHEALLLQLLTEEHWDIVQLDGIYLAVFGRALRRRGSAKLVLRAHNVEYETWQRLAQTSAPGPKRWYYGHLARRGHRFEQESLAMMDGILAITQRDADHFRSLGYTGSLAVVPASYQTGLESESPVTDIQALPHSLCFLGSLEWLPNVQGLNWFLREVWPAVRAAVPQATFHIAGKNPPPDVLDWKHDGVTVHGQVPSAEAFMAGYGPLVVPLLSGGGMRLKVVEAMAQGKCVLSTRIGAEGIDAPEDALLLADAPDELTAVCIRVLQEGTGADALSTRMGALAQHWAQQHYGLDSLMQQAMDFYTKLLNN